MVSPEDDGEVLLHLGDDVRTALMRQMDVHELVAAAEELDVDDLADFVEHLPETVTRQVLKALDADRSEEHTSELQSLMRISYAVFCLKKKKNTGLRQLYT